ncbi:MAG: endonuclease/exonuclease/phosphatase family protein [bacterium]|nr:endonuclease/exonuclease/phosphatase family protein [bacterium]
MKIKFITINTWHGGKLWDPLVEFIKRENPDIAIMQEVYNGDDENLDKNYRALLELRKALNYKYDSFAPNAIIESKIGDIEQGNLILSKFPILNQKVIFFDVPYGKFQHEGVHDFRLFPSSLQNAQVDLGDKIVNLFNIHGIWDFHGKDSKRRLKMSEKITSQVKDKENVILAGDFNVNYDTKTIGNVKNYLNNIFDGELKTSFNMKRKRDGGYATSAVDMIMVSKNIKVLSHLCPEVDLSDHLPLIAELEI